MLGYTNMLLVPVLFQHKSYMSPPIKQNSRKSKGLPFPAVPVRRGELITTLYSLTKKTHSYHSFTLDHGGIIAYTTSMHRPRKPHELRICKFVK